MNTPTGKLGQYLTTAFDPRTIPGCQLWLDAADSNTLTLSGSNVTQWNDKSGNGNNATTATGTIVYSSNVLNFTGSQAMSTPLSSVMTTQTMFAVASVNSASKMDILGVNRTVFGTGVQMIINNYVQQFTTYGGSLIANGGTVAQNVNFLYGTSYISGGNGFVYLNGSQTGSTSSSPAISGTATVMIGAYNDGAYKELYIGTINEIIIYNTVLSSSQRQTVEGYLAAKWGLTSSLPATHPFKSLPPISRQFAPVDISGCVLWIDAADASTVTLSGNNITQLQDKSSNAYVFATASGFTYNVTKFNTSYPSFYSPTSTAGYSLGSNASFTLNQPFTAFAVGGNLIEPANGGYFWDSTSNANRAALLSFSPGKPTMFAGVELFSTNSNSFTGALILTCRYNSTSSSIFENGSNVSSNTNVGTNNAVSLRLGAAWSLNTNWNGHICEILFFNRLVSTAEQQQIEGYLANKWGLRGNLASTHPFKLYSALTPAFTPVQISGCSLWLDAADRNTLTLSGTSVTQWTDKSGTGNTVTGGSGPTYTSNVYNGLGTLSFNGSQNLAKGSVTAGSLAGNNTTTFSMFIVCSFNNNTQRSSPISWDNSSYTSRILFQYFPPEVDFDFGTSPWRTGIVFTPTNNQLYIFSGIRNGSVGYLGINGGTNSATVTGLTTTNFSSTANTLNVGSYVNDSTINMKGNTCEIIYFNSALTTFERQAVEGYLANKWGLVSSIPASHPYKKFIN